jgi:hypothetical protein
LERPSLAYSLPEVAAEAAEAAVVAEAVAAEAVAAAGAAAWAAGAAEVAGAAAVCHGELAAGARSEHALTRSTLIRGSKDRTTGRRAIKARLNTGPLFSTIRAGFRAKAYAEAWKRL